MADRLLDLLQKADRERTAQLKEQGSPPRPERELTTADGQTVKEPAREKANPNVLMGRAMEHIPSQHNFTPPDAPKETPTVTGPVPINAVAPAMPGGNNSAHQKALDQWKINEQKTRQALAAITAQEAFPRTQSGTDGDRLKQLLVKAGADMAPTATPPTLGQTNNGPTV